MSEPEEEYAAIHNSCPSCTKVMDVSGAPPYSRFKCVHCGEMIRVRTQFHHFDIEREIGRGGMSRVLAAEDTNLGRRVALKILRARFSTDDSRLREFEREARITASMSHPNIVKVYSVGRDQGYYYIAMELVEGGSLEDRSNQGSISERRVLEWAEAIAGGLRAASKRGLIHRDIKPGNILLSSDGAPKIVDFGLAVFSDRQGGNDELWATPFYVAPEKLHGRPEDFRSDIYSLGATMFQLLAGQVPIDTDTTSISELKRLKQHIVSLEMMAPHVSVETCNLVDRMLLHDPEDRHGSYEELIQHIDLARRGLGKTELTGKLTVSLTVRAHKRREWLQWLGVSLVTAVALGFAVWLLRLQPDDVTGRPDLEELAAIDEGIISGRTATARYVEAREEMLRRRFGSARVAFEQLSDTPATRQPTRNWAIYYAGLCALLEGDLELAQESFAKLSREARDTEGSRLASFFLRVGNLLRQSSAVPSHSAGLAGAGQEKTALFAFGLHNYHKEKFAKAGDFLTEFRNLGPVPDHPWIDRLKPEADTYIAGVGRMTDLPRDSTAALQRARLSAIDTLLSNKSGLTSVEQRFLRNEKLRLGKLIASTSKKNRLGDARNQDPAADRKLIEAVTLELQPLVAELALQDAEAILADLEVGTKAGRKMLKDETQMWSFAAEFVSQIKEDLSGGYQGLVERKSGEPIEGRVTVDEGRMWLSVRNQNGTIRVALANVRIKSLLAMGEYFLRQTRDSNEYYARHQNLVAFAFCSGSTDWAKTEAEGLSREYPRFRLLWDRLQEYRKG